MKHSRQSTRRHKLQFLISLMCKSLIFVSIYFSCCFLTTTTTTTTSHECAVLQLLPSRIPGLGVQAFSTSSSNTHHSRSYFHRLSTSTYYSPKRQQRFQRYNAGTTSSNYFVLNANPGDLKEDEGESSWFFRSSFIKNQQRSQKKQLSTSKKQINHGNQSSKEKEQDKKALATMEQPQWTIPFANKSSPSRQSISVPTSPLQEDDDDDRSLFDLTNPRTIFSIAAVAGVSAIVAISASLGLSLDDYMEGARTLLTDPQVFSQELIDGVQSLGPSGVIYYALIYMIAEILAIPATPLTLSAGYLFGLQNGILTVLTGATGAACIGFWISRTFLRDYVTSTLLAPSSSSSSSNGDDEIGNGQASPNTLAKLDKAIGKEGFKLLILIRLSPIFPFSVTNYLYGASSIDFGSYLVGTLIGFVPTTSIYVYTGMVGQALTLGGGGDSTLDQPWYFYAGGFIVLSGLIKLVTDVASEIIEAIDEKEDGSAD